MIKKITFLLLMLTSSLGFSQELLTNGDFQTGDGTGWNLSAIVDLDSPNGDYAFQTEVAVAGNAWDVNLAQTLSLTTGITYELSFDAYTNSGNTRTIIAGIGQNGGAWNALTETPTLTDVSQTFTYQFTVNYGSPESSRVLFDMGADTGFVTIDNVSLTEYVAPAGTDASLSDLTVDGSTIANFGANISSYDVELAAGTTTVPTVAATPTDTNATVQVTDATSIPGATTILVTAQDETTTNTVTINFTLNPDPTVNAPTPPTRNSSDVISIYSDAYNDISLAEFPTSWSEGTHTFITIDGDNTIKATSSEFIGIVSDYGTGTDLTNMEYMHIDYYTASSEGISVKLVNTIANNENIVSLGTTVSGEWKSVDIAMSAFTGVDLSQITQFLIDPATGIDVYYDNFYFYKEEALSVGEIDTESKGIYPNPTTGLINVTGDIYNTSGQLVLKNSNDLSGLPSGLYFVRVITNGSVSTSKVVKR